MVSFLGVWDLPPEEPVNRFLTFCQTSHLIRSNCSSCVTCYYCSSTSTYSGWNGSVMGGLGSMVVEGMALGTGSAIAHRAVDAVMGPRVVEHENVAKAAATAPHGSMAGSADSEVCGGQSEAFLDCLNHYESEISKCQFHMDMLHEYMPHKHGAALGA